MEIKEKNIVIKGAMENKKLIQIHFFLSNILNIKIEYITVATIPIETNSFKYTLKCFSHIHIVEATHMIEVMSVKYNKFFFEDIFLSIIFLFSRYRL